MEEDKEAKITEDFARREAELGRTVKRLHEKEDLLKLVSGEVIVFGHRPSKPGLVFAYPGIKPDELFIITRGVYTGHSAIIREVEGAVVNYCRKDDFCVSEEGYVDFNSNLDNQITVIIEAMRKEAIKSNQFRERLFGALPKTQDSKFHYGTNIVYPCVIGGIYQHPANVNPEKFRMLDKILKRAGL